MLTAEVAIYPLKAKDASGVINHSIDTLKGAGISYTVDPMKTHLSGSRQEVFRSLESMFDKAQGEGGEVSMVVTITNAAN